MEELQIAKVHVSVPHIVVLPHIHRSSTNKNETNTIQETRELTEQEQKIANAGGFIITIFLIAFIIVFAVKVWKERDNG